MNDPATIIRNGLTYGGDPLHSLINYALLIITLIPFLFALLPATAMTRRLWVVCLLAACAVQGVLWFTLDAVGISVVWSVMAGYYLVALLGSGWRLRGAVARMLPLVFVAGGIAFYAITSPPITTVAHGTAVALGVVLYAILRGIAAGVAQL